MTKTRFLSTSILIVVLSAAVIFVLNSFRTPLQYRYHYSHDDDDITKVVDKTSTVSRILSIRNDGNNNGIDENDSSLINDIPNNDNNNELNQLKIPYNLIFTYKTNILHTRSPSHLHKNIVHTIESYKSAIRKLHENNPPPIRVIFLDDATCHDALSSIYPPLLPFFESEPFGVFRGDVCRIVALYRHGGYYFDVDMEVVEPIIFSPSITFSTVIQPRREDFFQSFLAAAKGHPVLRRTLGYMLMVYEGKKSVDLLGTMTLRWGYDEVMQRRRNNNKELRERAEGEGGVDEEGEEKMPSPEGVKLLEEVHLLSPRYGRMYLSLKREGFGCCCNYVVHDPQKEVVHFYSRIVGYSKRCSFEPIEEIGLSDEEKKGR